MPPPPAIGHQDFEWSLETYLRLRWAPGRKAIVHHQVAVAPANGWPNNYRVPDLVLLLPEGLAIDRQQYLEGGPDVAVEFHSPATNPMRSCRSTPSSACRKSGSSNATRKSRKSMS
jgi:Uma2 family endonuclease